MPNHWQILTFPPLEDMRHVREQYHQAIQNVVAVGRSFLPESKGDEFANLTWDFKLQRLVGQWIEGETIFRSSISLREFTVYLVDRQFGTISMMPMQGARQRDVMVWLEHQLSRLGKDFTQINLTYPYEIPEYPTAKREPFSIENMDASSELSRYYHNTAILLEDIIAENENTSAIKCWPHHFDIATVITLFDTGDPETSRSIGVGFSPGDRYYDEPYFYVTPWPYPTATLPDLSLTLGHWHAHDWIGAILPSSKLAHLKSNYDQQRTILKFIKTGIRVLKELL